MRVPDPEQSPDNAHHLPLRWVSDLIDRHCRFSTRNLQDVQDHLRAMRGGVRLSVERPQDFVSYREVVLAMGHFMLTIGCVDSGNGYDLSFKSGEEYIVTIPLRGTGWASIGGIFAEYAHGDIMIVSPLCRIDKHWDGPGEVVSIHIPAEMFDAAVADIGPIPLLSRPITRIGARQSRSFVRIVDMICSDLQDESGSSPFLQSPLSDQAEKMMLSLLLENLRVEAGPSQRQASTSPAIPYYVRRAEKFITANAHLSIGLEEIAQAAGVSTRTIQYGFRNFFKTTPMLYLKQTRYERARDILLSSNGDQTIGEIAMEIGCQNISQFSRDYRSIFGETPSNTLATPKGLVC